MNNLSNSKVHFMKSKPILKIKYGSTPSKLLKPLRKSTRLHQHNDVINIPKEIKEPECLLTFNEYFSPEIRSKAIQVDGHYHGWLAPDMIEKYGLAHSAKEAWESNESGQLYFKQLNGTTLKGKPAGWSNAKFTSYQLFRNFNTRNYFNHMHI